MDVEIRYMAGVEQYGRVEATAPWGQWSASTWPGGNTILAVSYYSESGNVYAQIQGSIFDVLSRVDALVALVGNGVELDLADVANAIDRIGRALGEQKEATHAAE